MSRVRLQRSGILSNTYTPPIGSQQTDRELSKLSTEPLFNLTELWLTLSATQPIPTEIQRRRGITQQSLVKECKKIFSSLKQVRNFGKRKLINHILVDFYPRGLNALQLAQIDVQLLIDKPNTYSWVSSTAKIITGPEKQDKQELLEDFIFSLDSQSFLDQLIANLSNLYLTHVYISRHPNLPLILIRIQMYEYIHLKKSNNNKINLQKPDIVSRKPYYLAIPLSSPNLIHSSSNEEDLTSKLILQSVETTLSSSQLGQVKLFKNNESPLRTLESMLILKGISRFGSSLGSWIPFADGTIDIDPLSTCEDHLILNPNKLVNLNALSKETNKREREIISGLKFKGIVGKNLRSNILFDENRSKLRRIESTKNSPEKGVEKNTYSSVVPVQQGDFIIQNSLNHGTDNNNNEDNEVGNDDISIRIRFMGSDIFAGLQELAVNGVLNPENVPSWVTGEEGMNNGIIKHGEFIKRD